MAHHDDAPSRRDGSQGQRPTRRRARVDRAAMASNWRQVLAVDALLGLAILSGGVLVAVLLSPAAGGVLGAVGALYLGAGVRRWRRWARLRSEAGLDRPDRPDADGSQGPAVREP